MLRYTLQLAGHKSEHQVLAVNCGFPVSRDLQFSAWRQPESEDKMASPQAPSPGQGPYLVSFLPRS